jgi:hypothetical protein
MRRPPHVTGYFNKGEILKKDIHYIISKYIEFKLEALDEFLDFVIERKCSCEFCKGVMAGIKISQDILESDKRSKEPEVGFTYD